MRSHPTYTKHSVTSADGTTIGYRRCGAGPGLLLLHGGVNAAQHMMGMAQLLQDSFTVYLPDRRGRGLSGPYGAHYTIESEDEDLAALVRTTGARFVFGPANGALFALHGSIELDQVEKVAAYEPLLHLNEPGIEQFVSMFTTTQDLVRRGELGRAMWYSAAETAAMEARRGAYPMWVAKLLQRTPVAWFDLFLRLERSTDDRVAWGDLLRALPDELDLVIGTAGTLEEYRRLEADVLLMYGSKSHPVFEATAQELDRVLPSSTVVRLPGLNHDAAQTYGHPEAIAAAIRVFLTE